MGSNEDTKGKDFFIFAVKRVVIGLVVVVAILWGISLLMGLFGNQEHNVAIHHTPEKTETHDDKHAVGTKTTHDTTHKPATGHTPGHGEPHETDKTSTTKGHGAAKSASGHAAPASSSKVKGVMFVEALIRPLNHELEERFWGWRVNDIVQFTDNVNNIQKGVLEVTRRTCVILAERVSRTGSTDAFEPELERAMNWFMIKADQLWLPLPETAYSDALDELREYVKKLKGRQAYFYNRADNLVPLLASWEDLLGSCDENLLRHVDEGGDHVGWSKADDYLYYAKGVATALLPLLEAVHVDFHDTLEAVQGNDILHHAIESCRHASEIDPWVVLESDLDSLFANHRSNMAGPISHARFYMGLLIKALTT